MVPHPIIWVCLTILYINVVDLHVNLNSCQISICSWVLQLGKFRVELSLIM